MNLTHEQLAQINVEIDRYTIVPNTEKIGCECIIADTEEYYTVVTFDELREYIGADKKGMIDIITSDGEDICTIHFSEWLQDQMNTGVLRENLENYINTRENRKPLHQVVKNPLEDIPDALQEITKGFKSLNRGLYGK